MNIIICDDSQNDRKILIDLLQSYAQEKKKVYKVLWKEQVVYICFFLFL